MSQKKILIVGAGASGLMAGIMAAREGAKVTILEHNDKPGKKINATGNGKCNLTNLNQYEEAYRGTHPEFARDALAAFSLSDTLDFFSSLGLYLSDRNGYVYPHSGQASSVTEVLCMEAAHLGVTIKTREHVTRVFYQDSRWKVQTEGWTYEGDRVILAGGSCASSLPGADGSNYHLAQELGHTLIPPLPALTALKCRGNRFSPWAGVRTEGTVTLYIDKKPVMQERGELQLTEYGVSGIPVFQLSRYGIRALEEGHLVTLSLDFLPEFTPEELTEFLRQRKQNCPYKKEKDLLVGLFPEKLGKVLLSKGSLEKAIKEFPLEVQGGLPFGQAQICSGGVDTSQVHSKTMESRLHPGLYFAGELLDIDGTCGGYNLQWAWSSGAVAGQAAARSANRKERT